MGKAPTHCSPGCFDREGRECGPWRPESSASVHQGLPDSRLPSRQESWSLVPFCPAQLLDYPQSMLSPFWALKETACRRRLCVLAWAGNSRGIEENNAKIWASLGPAIPFSVYKTQPQKCLVRSVAGLTHSHYQTNAMCTIIAPYTLTTVSINTSAVSFPTY